LTENVLGGIKKNGQPMFDIHHGSSDLHVTTGVFPHGGDPSKGFIVDNTTVENCELPKGLERDFKTGSHDRQMQFLIRNHMDKKKEGTATHFGDTYTQMDPPGTKVRTK
jgi:hypothetical protein